MDASNVLNGIDAGAQITQGQFFRLTFSQRRFLLIPVGGLFGFASNMQSAFDKLDQGDSLAQPVSDLAIAPGQEAAVLDILVRPAAVGVTAAYLANYLDTLKNGVELTSLTPIDVSAVQQGQADRSLLQSQLDQSSKAKDPFAVFGTYARYLEWSLLALLLLAAIYYGSRALRVVKAVV